MNVILGLLFIVSSIMAGEVFSGTVISQNKLNVSSRYMGYVKKLTLHEGDTVKRGELLYSIDSEEIDLAHEQALLSLDQIKLMQQMQQNKLNQATLVLQRYKRLYKKNMIAKIEVENLQVNVDNLHTLIAISQKQIKQVHTHLKNIQHQYSYLNIIAPHDGVIVEKNINQGDISVPAMTTLVIADLEDLMIEVEVTEALIVNLKKDMPVDVEIPSIKYTTQGVIKNIIPYSKNSAHRFKIKIAFKNKNGEIYPGMYAKITMKDIQK